MAATNKMIALEDIRVVYNTDPEAIKEMYARLAQGCANTIQSLTFVKELYELYRSRLHQVIDEALAGTSEFGEENSRERIVALSEETLEIVNSTLTISDEAHASLQQYDQAIQDAFNQIHSNIEAATDARSFAEAITPLYAFERDPAGFMSETIGASGAKFGAFMEHQRVLTTRSQEFSRNVQLIDTYSEELEMEHKINADDEQMLDALANLLESSGTPINS